MKNFLFFIFHACLILLLAQTAQAEQVAIDDTVSTTATAHNGNTPTTVFVSDQTGYTFYIDSTNTCVYSKTTDGGASWSASVTVDSQTDCLGVGVWYDRWTPGDSTGTYIHIVTFDSGADDLWYTRLDTSNDTLTIPVSASASAGQGGTFTTGQNLPSITKGTNGTIYMGIHDVSDSFIISSSDGVSWTEAGTNPLDLQNDYLILMPLSGGNIMAIRRDVSADDIQSKVFNGSSWDTSWTAIDTNATENSTYDASFFAALNKSTGDIYLAYVADNAAFGTDDDIRTYVYSGGVWTSKADVLTDDSKGITDVTIALDENTGDIYVAYTARTTAGTANTANVYYKKSTDRMASWGSEQGPLNTSSDDIYGVRLNCMSNERIYVTWYGAAPDDFFGDTIADIAPPPPPPEPPRVTITIKSTNPSGGATDVSVKTTVSATFSMLINGSTVDDTSFRLSNGENDIEGTTATDGETAIFTPLANLDYTTTYTARVTTKVRAANYAGTTLDNDYVWTFTTTENTPPTVVSTNPVNGAADIPVNNEIAATFNEEMDSATFAAETFTINDGDSNISGTTTVSGMTVAFIPSENLESYTTYTSTIASTARDAEGDALESDYTWSFTTADIIAPVVVSTSPANGEAEVAVDSAITVEFSEEMDASTITTDSFTVNDGTGNIRGTISCEGTTATFTPTESLLYSTTFTATLTTGIKDLAGNPLASDYTWSFATVDITPPTVVSTSPENGAGYVAVNISITATFSEDMDSSTITTDTFTVSDGNSNISGKVTYKENTAAFKPSGNLSNFTTYTAKITTGVKDAAGNAMSADYMWSFTTIEITPPEISSTNPANGAVDVSVESSISAAFSETIDASTIKEETFIVSDGNDMVSGTISYSDTTATFKPINSLSYSTVYTATITTGVKDIAGNAMSSGYMWSFTTAEEPDTTPPVVISIAPANGAADVSVNTSITATFSEEMDESTINTETFRINDGSSDIEGTVSYSDKTATFQPLNPLSSITYSAKITTGAKDIAGNALTADYTWSFTPDTTPPAVFSTSPVNGTSGVDRGSYITATFNETMDASSITADTFTVRDGSNNIAVGGTVSYSGITATFIPSDNIAYSTIYTARVTSWARDVAGNSMSSAYTWSFTTVSGDASPTIVSTSPANGAAGVAVTSTISATFSNEMDDSTIKANTFVLSDGIRNIRGDVSYSDMTATFTSLRSLNYSATYIAKITTGARDTEGNPLSSDYTWSFTTTETESQEERGFVSGHVFDDEKKPLRGTIVTIKGNRIYTQSETTEAGRYVFRNIARGIYTITYKKDGYQTQVKEIRMEKGKMIDLGVVILKDLTK